MANLIIAISWNQLKKNTQKNNLQGLILDVIVLIKYNL